MPSSSGKRRATPSLQLAQPLKQSRLEAFCGGSSSDATHAQQRRPQGGLRQASLTDLRGVVDYRDDEDAACGATTLYLGESDLLRLKATLEDATAAPETLLRVLRRSVAQHVPDLDLPMLLPRLPCRFQLASARTDGHAACFEPSRCPAYLPCRARAPSSRAR